VAGNCNWALLGGCSQESRLTKLLSVQNFSPKQVVLAELLAQHIEGGARESPLSGRQILAETLLVQKAILAGELDLYGGVHRNGADGRC